MNTLSLHNNKVVVFLDHWLILYHRYLDMKCINTFGYDIGSRRPKNKTKFLDRHGFTSNIHFIVRGK